ncbi:type I toxin-antitoxin system Fst family toxin [Staphylococcus epidermidis]
MVALFTHWLRNRKNK